MLFWQTKIDTNLVYTRVKTVDICPAYIRIIKVDIGPIGTRVPMVDMGLVCTSQKVWHKYGKQVTPLHRWMAPLHRECIWYGWIKNFQVFFSCCFWSWMSTAFHAEENKTSPKRGNLFTTCLCLPYFQLSCKLDLFLTFLESHVNWNFSDSWTNQIYVYLSIVYQNYRIYY